MGAVAIRQGTLPALRVLHTKHTNGRPDVDVLHVLRRDEDILLAL